jgi:Uma2 family endonuclease
MSATGGSATMQTAYRLLEISDEEIELLSARNPGYSFERSASGELIVSPPNGFASSSANAEFTYQLAKWNKTSGHGRITDSSGGFHLPDGSLLQPDGAWVSERRFLDVPEAKRDKYLPLCPDAVVEILSPSDHHILTRNKVAEFMRNGARIGVFIDPFKRTVEVSRDDRGVERFERPKTVTLERAYFEGADGDWVLDCAAIFGD